MGRTHRWRMPRPRLVRPLSTLRSHPTHAVLLAGPDPPGDPVLGEHDGVGVHMATDPPCERCVGEFLRRRLPIGDDGPVVGLSVETVILLDQETVGHLPDGEGRCRIGHRHGEDAGVLSFADQLLDDPVLVTGGQDDIGLCRINHGLDRGEIHDPVGGDDATERRTRSHSNARRYAEARSAATAAPHGLACFMIATAGCRRDRGRDAMQHRRRRS